MFNKSF